VDNTKTLLVDMDGIVADLATEWYGRWNKNQVRDWLSVDNVTTWDVAKIVKDPRIDDILTEKGLFLSLKPMEGCREALQSLFERKLKNGKPAYDIFFATSAVAAPHIPAEKIEWALAHFPWLNARKIFTGYHKYMIRGDFLLDDAPKNLVKYKEHNPNATCMTIDYPYNREVMVGYRARGYKNMKAAWEGIERYLQALATFPEGYQNLD